MAPAVTPSGRSMKEHATTPLKTPQSRHRLHFPNPKTPNSHQPAVPTEHPVEVIGRIREHPDRKDRPSSSLEITDEGRSVRVRTDIGYRDFTLDGVSMSEEEDLGGFYSRFVASRIQGVRLGAKCTVMMYGPTGSGKSHTMFGCPRQPGIVYRALRDILGEEGEGNNGVADEAGFGVGMFVQVAVLEIYNEEIYDLLSSSSTATGAAVGLPKGQVPKARLEVMGKKAKNANYITGNDAGKISREVAKVEKRRIVKSTLCNERSSRSHCLIILDVPSVGGRLMLVDMAGSENIEQAGQNGFEAKMQTAKINQGNTALKRVVESIANGDSHVPFRDSKLTMLLQDSFEDDKSKILMILCASPDPKEMHKTISTFEYGAKAKCIVRVAHATTPRGGDAMSSEESSMLGSRIAAMNQFIFKLQMENKLKEKERDDARKDLQRKEEEIADLRRKLAVIEGRCSTAREEEISSEISERTLILKLQVEKMEARISEQQNEIIVLRQRLGEAEIRRNEAREMNSSENSGFMKRLAERYPEGGDQGMEKSMELDMGDQPTIIHEVREVVSAHKGLNPPLFPAIYEEEEDSVITGVARRFCLSTVFEGDEEEAVAEEKEVVEENKSEREPPPLDENGDIYDYGKDALSRSTRIRNIFRLCGNYRELGQQNTIALIPSKKNIEEVAATEEPLESKGVDEPKAIQLQFPSSIAAADNKENFINPGEEEEDDDDQQVAVDVYVKWETSKEMSGNLIKKMKVSSDATLAHLRKLIELHLAEEKNQQPFTFLLLGDPTGAPVAREKEGELKASKLPVCNNQLRGHLACLRPAKKIRGQKQQGDEDDHLPLGALENKLAALHSDIIPCFGEKENFSPNIGHSTYFSG